jgi:hypothetical protein
MRMSFRFHGRVVNLGLVNRSLLHGNLRDCLAVWSRSALKRTHYALPGSFLLVFPVPLNGALSNGVPGLWPGPTGLTPDYFGRERNAFASVLQCSSVATVLRSRTSLHSPALVESNHFPERPVPPTDTIAKLENCMPHHSDYSQLCWLRLRCGGYQSLKCSLAPSGHQALER